ncbi:MAG TPA: hypothetical protein VGD66_04075 [Allosphingosinicella sp.]|jgi:hypothetical protein
MSGYMVMAWFGGTNGFYMVNSDTREGARAEVDKLTGQTNAQALTVLSDDTLKYFDVQPGRPQLRFSTLPGMNGVLGEVASSEFDMG